MTTNKKSRIGNDSATTAQDSKLSFAVRALIRALGIVNGTITLRVRGGQFTRAIEIVNFIDVESIE
jgi:hypothetical protein